MEFSSANLVPRVYTIVICEFTRNNGLRKYIFFINPGKYFLPGWIDETKLLKLHAQLTYKQETQYTIFLTMQL